MAVVPVLAGRGRRRSIGARATRARAGTGRHRRVTGGGLDPASLLKPLADTWPTYSGDYTGRRYSTLKQITPANVKGLTLAWVARISPGSGERGAPAAEDSAAAAAVAAAAAAPTIVGGEGTGDFATRRRRQRQGRDPGRSTACSTSPRPTTPGRSTRATAGCCGSTSGRPRAAPTSAAAARRCGTTTCSSRPPTTTSSRSTRRPGKERWHVEIAGLQPAVLLDDGPDRHRRSGAGRHRQRPRRPGLPAVVRPGDRQAAVDLLHRADEAGRSRPRHLAEPRSGASRRRAGLDSRASTIPRRSCTSSARATRRRATRASAARATTSSPARSWRSTWTRARWPGTTRRRRTIRTTGIRRRRRS